MIRLVQTPTTGNNFTSIHTGTYYTKKYLKCKIRNILNKSYIHVVQALNSPSIIQVLVSWQLSRMKMTTFQKKFDLKILTE